MLSNGTVKIDQGPSVCKVNQLTAHPLTVHISKQNNLFTITNISCKQKQMFSKR